MRKLSWRVYLLSGPLLLSAACLPLGGCGFDAWFGNTVVSPISGQTVTPEQLQIEYAKAEKDATAKARAAESEFKRKVRGIQNAAEADIEALISEYDAAVSERESAMSMLREQGHLAIEEANAKAARAESVLAFVKSAAAASPIPAVGLAVSLAANLLQGVAGFGQRRRVASVTKDADAAWDAEKEARIDAERVRMEEHAKAWDASRAEFAQMLTMLQAGRSGVLSVATTEEKP